MIASNPGFGSRIQFWIDFPDYSNEELRELIYKFLSKETIAYTITDDALNEMLNLCEFYRCKNDFANARTVRKMLQDIIMNQNLRVEDELDNNQIILDDVIQFEEDNGIVKIEKDNTPEIDKEQVIRHIVDSSQSINVADIDNNYLEQAVISISDDDSQGTGFIISPDGLCLTCAHCLNLEPFNQKARIIMLLADGQKIKNYVGFEVLFVDPTNDFALIKLSQLGFNYKYLPLTMIKDLKLNPLREFIMAGYPFGGEVYTSISLTKGNIASVNKIDNRVVVFADMFGKPGSSGSPIIDIETKKVIGIFWGGISENSHSEKIYCFTAVDVIWNSMENARQE